ncbi:hypothetical protein [Paenibacillus sp. FSL L8-0708]|uniref:hypothetical protein n=1 Tax=Paenibacillus sp. FSL L8-0708 TaxID=2975311 RepID=UPI0030F92C8E
MSTTPLNIRFINANFGKETISFFSADQKERLCSTMRLIIHQEGVSSLLAALKVNVNERPSEDRERVWRILLPVAEEVIHGLYARPGESLLVWSNIPPWVAMETPYEPMIMAQVTNREYGCAEWFADPRRNVFKGWERVPFVHLDKEMLSRGFKRYPDNLFEGSCHFLEFDWSMYQTDQASFINKLHDFSEVIGASMVNAILLQLVWRVPEGKEAEEKFLRAVFGEVCT